MIYPIVTQVRTGGGSMRPFSSMLEMIAFGCIILFFTIGIIGLTICLSSVVNSKLVKIFVWLGATLLIVALWCLFASCC